MCCDYIYASYTNHVCYARNHGTLRQSKLDGYFSIFLYLKLVNPNFPSIFSKTFPLTSSALSKRWLTLYFYSYRYCITNKDNHCSIIFTFCAIISKLIVLLTFLELSYFKCIFRFHFVGFFVFILNFVITWLFQKMANELINTRGFNPNTINV